MAFEIVWRTPPKHDANCQYGPYIRRKKVYCAQPAVNSYRMTSGNEKETNAAACAEHRAAYEELILNAIPDAIIQEVT